MKKELLIVLLLIASVSAATTNNPTIDVTLLRYEPVPATPGDTITVWLQIENNGQLAATNVQLLVDESYPFTPVSAQDSRVNVGTIASKNEYVTSVKVAVDRNAPQGSFALHARTTTDGQNYASYDLVIPVQSSTSSLAVKSAKTSPAELVPGSTATLSIAVKNIEESLLRDVTVNVDLEDTVFAPIGGTNQQKYARIASGEEITFPFTILTEPDSASGVFRIPVTISYTTNEGVQVSQQETIGLVVRSEPQIGLYIDETNIYTDYKEGTVLLRLVNKGLSEVKFVEVTLESADGFALNGNNPSIYVGNIDSDDFETIEYSITPSKDSFSLPVHITYTDSLNKKYENSINLPITLQKAVQKGSKTWIVLVVIVVVIAGVVIYRRRKKR